MSGQSLTSPTQENIDRVSSEEWRVRKGYSLLPELPGRLLGKTVLNFLSAYLPKCCIIKPVCTFPGLVLFS